tara:strand:+ start:321 stop:455 length:135 start_codon:yes stop_codon:yes gene_type:complete
LEKFEIAKLRNGRMEGWKDEGMTAWIRGGIEGLIQRSTDLRGLG